MIEHSTVFKGMKVVMRDDLSKDEFERIGVNYINYTPNKIYTVRSADEGFYYGDWCLTTEEDNFIYPSTFFDVADKPTVLLSEFLLNNK